MLGNHGIPHGAGGSAEAKGHARRAGAATGFDTGAVLDRSIGMREIPVMGMPRTIAEMSETMRKIRSTQPLRSSEE